MKAENEREKRLNVQLVERSKLITLNCDCSSLSLVAMWAARKSSRSPSTDIAVDTSVGRRRKRHFYISFSVVRRWRSDHDFCYSLYLHFNLIFNFFSSYFGFQSLWKVVQFKSNSLESSSPCEIWWDVELECLPCQKEICCAGFVWKWLVVLTLRVLR